MPRFTDRFLPPTPKYRKHRASGQAVVTLYGRDFYLGPHGTKASRTEYDRLISEWLAAGRPSQAPSVQNDITVVELAAAYRKYAKSYYVKHGKPTDTMHQVNRATEIICVLGICVGRPAASHSLMRGRTRSGWPWCMGAKIEISAIESDNRLLRGPVPTVFWIGRQKMVCESRHVRSFPILPVNGTYRSWRGKTRHCRPPAGILTPGFGMSYVSRGDWI